MIEPEKGSVAKLAFCNRPFWGTIEPKVLSFSLLFCCQLLQSLDDQQNAAQINDTAHDEVNHQTPELRKESFGIFGAITMYRNATLLQT